MKTISQLTPAENYLLTNQSLASLKELLKYTFIDLLLKKVLKFNKPSKYKTLSAINICIGPKFSTYFPKKHELAFLEIFNKSRDLNIMFSKLIKVSYQYAHSKQIFVFDHLFDSSNISKSLLTSTFHRLFFNIQLTKDGLQLEAKIRQELKELEKSFPKLIRNNPREGKAILNKIKGNVFLLKNVDFELLKEIEPSLKKPPKDIEEKDTDCFFYFDSYDTFSTLFDQDYERAKGEKNTNKSKPKSSSRSNHRSSGGSDGGSFWDSIWGSLWGSIWDWEDGDGDGGCGGGCGGCG